MQISRLASGVSYAGKGLIALDAGIRINGVHNVYKSGGNWQREAAIQTVGFGAGTAIGLAAGKTIVGGLTAIGLGLTPLGWVVLIGVGLTVAFGAAYGADQLFQGGAGFIYDRGWR